MMSIYPCPSQLPSRLLTAASDQSDCRCAAQLGTVTRFLDSQSPSGNINLCQESRGLLFPIRNTTSRNTGIADRMYIRPIETASSISVYYDRDRGDTGWKCWGKNWGQVE